MIDQLWLELVGATRLAVSATSIPVLKAMVTASTARGTRSSTFWLQLTAAAARAPVHKPRTRESAYEEVSARLGLIS